MDAFFERIFSEYGLLVLILLVANIEQYRRSLKRDERILTAFEANTEARVAGMKETEKNTAVTAALAELVRGLKEHVSAALQARSAG